MYTNTYPWILLGDFNVVRDESERCGGGGIDKGATSDFNNCIQNINIFDLKYSGCLYTWNNSQDDRIFSKLDRAMVNEEWLEKFTEAEAYFPTQGSSDHCPCIVTVKAHPFSGKKPFKFFNFWTKHHSYQAIVARVWAASVKGTPMYRLCTKLKSLKSGLQELNKSHYANISSKVAEAKHHLDSLQIAMQTNQDPEIIAEEKAVLLTYKSLLDAEEEFYKQKARDNWIKLGDQNTSYFHKKVRGHRARNKILAISDVHGNRFEDYEDVKRVIIDYFRAMLGKAIECPLATPEDVSALIQPCLSDTQLARLQADITDEEIKNALFSMPNDKAPGHDGHTALFFKHSWDVVGKDFRMTLE